jgi:hypothetical protein
MDSKGSATSYQGICGYVSLMVTSKFDVCLHDTSIVELVMHVINFLI